eukprot:TRINITY_DN4111_c0_g1_i1.p1 TRINITY_DN4111_c0_g1~~TRINITY_DN4111_c0_g1_i1.p1  ORF type:complete len:380 (-),score=86.79 TRINITY_DN4111_c0_g1_i1:203-1273(-)
MPPLPSSNESKASVPSLSELKAAIPSHCFEKDWKRSTYYMLRDFAFVGLMYYFMDYFVSSWIGYFVWANIVGFLGWCLFVVGHDCGHGTFSNNWWYNQLCGHLTHSVILVPFNGWQISHHKHHRFHNHIDKDESWKPMRKSYFENMDWAAKYLFRKTPLALVMYPWYLLGLPDSPLLSGSHFDPNSRLFNDNNRVRGGVSAVAVAVWLGALLYLVPTYSFFYYYFVPYLIFTMWLSMVTLLQHTDPKGNFFDDRSWSFQKGGLFTIDRNFGSLINHLHHNIETHVVHHFFFTKIPHYHLVEATEAVKPLLGDNYIFDPANPFMALLTTLDKCDYIEPVEGKPGTYMYAQEPKSKAA